MKDIIRKNCKKNIKSRQRGENIKEIPFEFNSSAAQPSPTQPNGIFLTGEKAKRLLELRAKSGK